MRTSSELRTPKRGDSAPECRPQHAPGWILTGYFYDQLITMERDGISLKDNIGQMVYGMDVDRERRRAQQIAFLPETSHEFVRRSTPAPTGLRLAEMKMMQGDSHTAEEIATKALTDPAADHGTANYILGRIDLLDRQPDDAVSHFQAPSPPARIPIPSPGRTSTSAASTTCRLTAKKQSRSTRPPSPSTTPRPNPAPLPPVA